MKIVATLLLQLYYCFHRRRVSFFRNLLLFGDVFWTLLNIKDEAFCEIVNSFQPFLAKSSISAAWQWSDTSLTLTHWRSMNAHVYTSQLICTTNYFTSFYVMDILQISPLIWSEFKRINLFYSPWNHQKMRGFQDYFRRIRK